MKDESSQELPQPGKGDYLHAGAKGAMSAIPLVGGAISEWFALVFCPPLSRRRDAWLQALRDALDALASKIEGLKGEDLAQNEAFVSGVLHTTQLALRTHQKEKLEALRNSVLNIAIGRAPGEDLQQIFLDHIDTLTTWHLRILKFFQAPQQHSPNTSFHVGAPANVLEATFTELHGRRNFYDQIVKDLYAKGLMSLESLHVMMTVGGMYEKRTTPLGDQFLAFIAAPPELTA